MPPNPELVRIQKIIRDGKYRQARRKLLRMNGPVARRWLHKLEHKYPESIQSTWMYIFTHLYFRLTIILLGVALIAFIIWYDGASAEQALRDVQATVEAQIQATQAVEDAYDFCAGLYGEPFHTCVAEQTGG